MILLILALLFGAVALFLSIRFLIRAGKNGKATKVLSILVAAESVAFLVIFAIVFIKTLST